LIKHRQAKSGTADMVEVIDFIAKRAAKYNIPMASHDDDAPNKVSFMKQRGVTISEFPTNLETAKYAGQQGMHVVVGAPNVIRGVSNSGNMKAIEAIQNNSAHIICSDYMSSSVLTCYLLSSLQAWAGYR
jgi:alpha-D-ribose 1-methylphosphonate 5-triphosphate diphosphatase